MTFKKPLGPTWSCVDSPHTHTHTYTHHTRAHPHTHTTHTPTHTTHAHTPTHTTPHTYTHTHTHTHTAHTRTHTTHAHTTHTHHHTLTHTHHTHTHTTPHHTTHTHTHTHTHTPTPPAAVRTFLSVKFQFWWTVFDPEAISSPIFSGSTQTLNTTYFIWSIAMREAWLRLLTSILAAQTLEVWSACVVYITFGLTLIRGVAFQKAVIYIRASSECILSRFNFMYIYYGYENDFSLKFIAAWD